MRVNHWIVVGFLSLSSPAWLGCEGGAEEMGEEVDDAFEEAGDGFDDAVDEIDSEI